MSGGGRGILNGVRVLDLTRMLSGPYCTMMLADHGAEVIKIEPASGDTSRTNGPFRDDDPEKLWAGYFVSLNRSKRSVCLDLKSDSGHAAFRKLAGSADVVVENFRPGVMERLGLGYETLSADNPRLVYAAIRGFGDPRTAPSPYADWPSYDVVAQAMGGLMGVTGPDAATPSKVGPGVGDIFTGMMMAFGIIAALRAAESSGRGEFIDLAMYDAMISLCERLVYQHDFDGSVPGPEGNGHPLLAPFGVFPARDGHVAIGVVDDAFWQALALALGRPELASDPRYATRAARRVHRAEINALTADWTARHSKAELARLLGGRLPFGPVNTIADIMVDPHVAARGMIALLPHPEPGHRAWQVAANPLRFLHHPAPAPATPPRIGADQALLDEASLPMPDTKLLRNAFGTFATGVTVLTTRAADGTPRGFTANSFTSVSLDPPLLLVCLAKTAHSCPVFAEAPHFAVNVLAEEQGAVSGLFASRQPDKFARCAWRPGIGDVPLIEGTLAHFVCSRERLVDAGDHLVLVGRVLDFASREGQPLGFFRGNYFRIGLEDRLVAAAAPRQDVRLGAVLNCDGALLLEHRPGGALCLPLAPQPLSRGEDLVRALGARGLSASLGPLYAVFEDRETAGHAIYYHGSVSGSLPEGMALFPPAAIPFERITNAAERHMLRRYAEEYPHGSFGMYQGNETSGFVLRVEPPQERKAQ
ncbi:MAG: CoA transferase [Rhodobacteraceae bacterium]|nr:CoA transferase [Paracoccaceae bacterium]